MADSRILSVLEGVIKHEGAPSELRVHSYETFQDKPYTGPFAVGTGHQATATQGFLGDPLIHLRIRSSKIPEFAIRYEGKLPENQQLSRLVQGLDWLAEQSGVYLRPLALPSGALETGRSWEFRSIQEVPEKLSHYIDSRDGHQYVGIPPIQALNEARILLDSHQGMFIVHIGQPIGDVLAVKYSYTLRADTDFNMEGILKEISSIAGGNDLVAIQTKRNGETRFRFEKK